jgi:hypothetical protein
MAWGQNPQSMEETHVKALTTDTDLPQDLLDRAMQLPSTGREKLGQLLLHSVADSISARELIRSRIAQLVGGEVELLDAEEVAADLEREFGPGSEP